MCRHMVHMNNTAATTQTERPSTSQVHDFRISGCVNQWAADHDQAHCYAAFLAAEAKRAER
jgi:hypothetical protein